MAQRDSHIPGPWKGLGMTLTLGEAEVHSRGEVWYADSEDQRLCRHPQALPLFGPPAQATTHFIGLTEILIANG